MKLSRILCFAALFLTPLLAAQTPRLDQLDLLTSGYPRVFFFRAAENAAVKPQVAFEEWEKCFARLQGIEGKVLDEEVTRRSARNIDFFTRFKDAHPRQLVLEHYNGLARDPRDAGSRFFAGHWLYFGGVKLDVDVPAQSGESIIEVSDMRLFKTDSGRLGKSNDDIGLCDIAADGKPDWFKSEQVKLLEVKITRGKAGTIRVLRGQYGTTPRAFAKGGAYAAPHMSNGPWGKDGGLLWYFNFATTCPRDAQGRTCTDVLAEEFAELFGKGGRLEKFDGIEFDVMRHALGGRSGGLRVGDADADGKPDAGVVGGRDVYGEGVTAFCERLRERIGPDRLILADGWHWSLVRAFSALNGMESEGWPELGDMEVKDWCGGLNRAAFWTAHSAVPHLNYINHKGLIAEGVRTAPWPYHRLVFAGAMMTGSALCSTFAPPVADGELFGVWDEFWQGSAHKLGWLGQPLGAPVHLAFAAPDVLGDVAKRVASDNADVRFDKGLHITGKDAAQELTSFKLTVPVSANGELLVRFTARCAPAKMLPPRTPRLLRVGVSEARHELSTTWLNERAMDYTFYATGLPPNQPACVTFDIEGSEPLAITALAAHAQADAMVREFEHGTVLANPSAHPHEFDLPKLFPGRKFRRIQATPLQDKETNNGQPASGTITLGARDALFLIKE